MDIANYIRARETEEVVRSHEQSFAVSEALTTEILFLQLVPLDHGAHGTVDHKNAFGQVFPDQDAPVGPSESALRCCHRIP